jgi:excisionase family DNA binding protein
MVEGLQMAVAKEWFTVDEAAEYLSVSRRTVYKLTKDGRLPTYLIGRERHRRFRRQDLDNVPAPAAGAGGLEGPAALTAETDPVLAELWDNEKDAAYDQL